MKILFLAGGYDQIVFIDRLRAMGHYVVLVDYNEHPLAERHADEFFQISTLDCEAVENICRKKNIDRIFTACTDQALMTMAYVSERLHLPCYLSLEQAANVTNKKHMKEIFRKNNIPSSKFVTGTLTEIEMFAADEGYPLVVKPCDCNSSKGVAKVNNMAELRDAAELASRLSRTNTVIAEKFMAGRELSIDCWIGTNQIEILGITESGKINNSNGFTIVNSKYDLDNVGIEIIDKIKVLASMIAKGFSLANVPMLIQLIENNGEISVLEFSPRMGGGTKYRLINRMSSVDIIDTYIENCLLMDKGQSIKPALSNRKIAIEYLYMKDGKFCRIDGLECLEKGKLIDEAYIYKVPGANIVSHKNSGDRIAGVMLSGNDCLELEAKRKALYNTIKVMDDKDNDCLLRC